MFGAFRAGCGAALCLSPPATATPMGDDIDWLDLPGRWTYGVCGDGRIFFIKYGPAWLRTWSRGCCGDGVKLGCAGSREHGWRGVPGVRGLV